MNKQEMFDQITTHLLTQMQKAINSTGNCLYRDGDRACALGCTMKDSEYNEEMESNALSCNVFDPWLKRIKATSHGDRMWLGSMQQIHDNFMVEEWEGVLRRFAKTEQLEFNYAG